MKKLLSFGLLCVSFSAFSGIYPCMKLKITVKNNTPNTCYLVQQVINSGSISIPLRHYKIAPGTESEPMVMLEENFVGPNIVLSFECGQSFATFESQKNVCVTDSAVSGTILSIYNLENITFTTTAGAYWGNKSGTIQWTLS